MEDMERYGDYNDYEDDAPKSKNPVVLTIKILIAAVCVAVVAFLAFRITLFNYYPDSMKNVYFNEVLTEYYNQNGKTVEIKTQSLRAPYDDPDVASFFCDNLFIIEGAGQLQVSVRFNDSAIEHIESELGLSGLSASDPDLLSFKLATYNDEFQTEHYLNVEVSVAATERKLMYNYIKLVFDGINFGGFENPGWIRLDVFVKGSDEKFTSVYIYENNSSYSSFEDYELSQEELPK